MGYHVCVISNQTRTNFQVQSVSNQNAHCSFASCSFFRQLDSSRFTGLRLPLQVCFPTTQFLKHNINEVKTEFMILHKSHDTSIGNVSQVLLDGKPINRVYKFRYLGVIIDSNMTFKFYYNTVEAKVNSAIYKLQSVKRYVPELAMKIMFNAYVLPIYNYCIEVWCVMSTHDLDHLQSKINRFLFSYMFPSLQKKYTRRPRSMALHSSNANNMHHLLLRFNLLTVHERMIWTLLRNVYSFMSSSITILKYMFTFFVKYEVIAYHATHGCPTSLIRNIQEICPLQDCTRLE